MKIEGYMDFTIPEVKEILRNYAISQGYCPKEVEIPMNINSESIITVVIDVKPQVENHPK